MAKFLSLTIIFALAVFANSIEAKTIEKKRSLYQNVYVVEEQGMRCLRFRKKNKNDLSQSCIFLETPERLVFTYYKQAMGVTYFLDKPENILIIGLGGGILANTYAEIYPEAHITSVEIDEVVAEMAKKYFGYDDSAENKETHVRDGRVFVKRAIKKGLKYDLILLDAFNSDYIPEHMMTKEYLEEVKELVTDDGIIMANTFSSSKLFDHESATYHHVFGDMYQIMFHEGKTNRVIIVNKGDLPAKKDILAKANEMRNQLSHYGVDAFALYDAIRDDVNWDTEAKILTDQFSPANLLKD
ncbi:MAG: fused MFS/spermidine synthase [Gammaproteobacteria bacterium]|nr:fused MFS/spermidine synthase [Gammaproteobacteria bacterium]